MTDYDLTTDQADMLRTAALIPFKARSQLLAGYLAKHGSDALVALFGQFMGAANSVVENCREVSGIQLLCEGGSADPYISEKINMPTVAGAMQGVILAAGVKPKGTCGGCAYRLGSIANQSVPTTTDAWDCAADAAPFMCHEDCDADGEPTRGCVGHAKKIKVFAA